MKTIYNEEKITKYRAFVITGKRAKNKKVEF